MNIRLKAKGSGETPYDVDFCVTDGGDLLTVFCTCQAGSFGKNCKHKNELIAGDVSRLADPSDAPSLAEVQQIVSRAGELISITTEIRDSEQIIKTEQSKAKKAKKKLQAFLNDGVKLDGK